MELIDILHAVEQAGYDLRTGNVPDAILRLDDIEQALLDKVYGEPYTQEDEEEDQ